MWRRWNGGSGWKRRLSEFQPRWVYLHSVKFVLKYYPASKQVYKLSSMFKAGWLNLSWNNTFFNLRSSASRLFISVFTQKTTLVYDFMWHLLCIISSNAFESVLSGTPVTCALSITFETYVVVLFVQSKIIIAKPALGSQM